MRMKRVLRGLAAVILIALAVALTASAVVRLVAVHRAKVRFPPPGRLIAIDGKRSHIHCTGTGSPTVLLEAGLDDRASWSWENIQGDLSRHSRTCSYDRAGMIWSEPRREPRDAVHIANELHAVLAAAGEAPPYVLVGHSIGGLYVRVFDARYPGEAAGFVFVDASHPDQDRRYPAEFQQLVAKRRTEADHRWLFELLAPFRMFAPERPTPRTAYWWRSFPEGVLLEGRQIEASSAQARRAGTIGSRPVVVLTAGNSRPMPGVSQAGNTAIKRTWLVLQRELASLSTNSDHRVIAGAGHYIHWDRPKAVVTAIEDVVAAIRTRRTVRREEPARDPFATVRYPGNSPMRRTIVSTKRPAVQDGRPDRRAQNGSSGQRVSMP